MIAVANPKPLNEKIKICIDDIDFKDDKINMTLTGVIKIEDIKSACESFLSKIDDLYHQLEKGVVWGLNNDELCDMIEDYVKEKFYNSRRQGKLRP